MEQGKIIAITGGPRTGKSTLVKFLFERLGAVPFFEGEEKDFPPRIIENIKSGKNLLELMLWFRNKIISDYLRALELKKSGRIAILDTFLPTNDIYIEEWMPAGFEKECVKEMAAIDEKFLPWPDLVVALASDEETIRRFIVKGGRSFEQDEDYIKKQIALNKAHTDYFKKLDKPNIQFVSVADINYESSEKMDELVGQIKGWL